MPSNFWIKDLKKDGAVAFVGVGGRLGTSSAQEFLRHCQALLTVDERHIVIDMSAVEFIASSGAGALVVLSEHFRAKGGTVQVMKASAAVRRVVGLLNIDRFVVLVDDEEQALSNLQTQGV
jgi:anti-anti-sigma factor